MHSLTDATEKLKIIISYLQVVDSDFSCHHVCVLHLSFYYHYLNCVPWSSRILGGPRSLSLAAWEMAGKPGTAASHVKRPAVALVSWRLSTGPDQSQLSITMCGPIRGQYCSVWTHQRLVFNCVDQSQLSITMCGPITAQYCSFWTNQRPVLPVPTLSSPRRQV